MSIDRDSELTTIGIDLKDMDDSALHSVSIWLDCGQGPGSLVGPCWGPGNEADVGLQSPSARRSWGRHPAFRQ